MGGRHWKKDRYGMPEKKGYTEKKEENVSIQNVEKKETNSAKHKTLKKPRFAKSYGVKTNVYVNNVLYTTTYGNKNENIISKETDSLTDTVKEIDGNSSFNLSSINKKLNVSLKNNKDSKVSIGNPKYNPKSDIIKNNTKIEKMIFGQEFSDKDNIHIQIGYNILDMNKIISLYYYNIVYSINNLVRDSDFDINADFIGNIKFSKNFEEYKLYKNGETYQQGFNKFDKYAKSSYPYFSIFKTYDYPKTKDKDGNDLTEEEKEKNEIKTNKTNEPRIKYNFNLLRVLSFVRQSIAHSSKQTPINSLYRVNNENNILPKDLAEIINDKLNKDLSKINKDFNTHATKNLWVIKQITGSKNDKKLLEDYYNFIIYKENKNLGINNKKVRESLFDYYLEKYGIDIRNTNHDSYRKKINQIYDYFIYEYLKDNSNKYIEKLRSTASHKYREDEKAKIYHNIAVDFDNDHKNFISYNRDVISDLIWKSINKKSNNNIFNDFNIDTVTVNSFTLFSKIIYFISYFLETKEKNDLITALINKLDNIASLNNLYESICNNKVKYELNYSMFENSSKIADELRIIKNLSHMEAKLESAKGIIYEDVLRSLGYEGSKEECQNIITNFESKWINHPFRNFIVNNIISSNRYKYIVKYINPKYCNKYIKNENLIKYILNDIPNSQLDRYYFRITKYSKEHDDSTKENKVNVLYNKLLEVNYNNLSGNLSKLTEFKGMKTEKKTKIRHETYEIKPEKIEDIKSLVTLYYTVIYLAVKNLVNINSVFIIGFECLERDYAISKNLTNKKDVYANPTSELDLIKENEQEKDISNSALEFYKKKNMHNYKYLLNNVNEFNSISNIGKIFKHIRNNVMHMSIVNKAHEYLNEIELEVNPQSKIGNSVPVYYDLYAYVLERTILEEYQDKVIIDGKNYYNTVKKHYDKDLLKVLLIPFGYNLARYKNLTIRDLFYDQYKYLTEKED